MTSELDDREPIVAGHGDRLPAIDLLRAVALARVVVWHAVAATWLTWVAAMPIMFFAAGALLRTEGTLGSHVAFVRRRLRRLLIPMWAYGVGVAATMIYVPLQDERWEGAHNIAVGALTWVFPIVDPAGSAWHGGWLSGHLWYLRAYLWVLLLAPVLGILARHLLLTGTAVVLAATYLEAAARLGWPILGHGQARVLAGDGVVFGFFAVIGVAYARGRRPPGPIVCGAVGAVMFGGAAAFALILGLPEGGVNSSYGATLLIGLAWLATLAAVHGPVQSLAAHDAIARATRAVSARALTIYLWHPPAILLAYTVVGGSSWWTYAVLIVLTAGFTAVAVVAVGWLEDVSRGRWSYRWHTPTLRAAAVVPITVVTLAVAVPTVVARDEADAAAAASSGPRRASPPSFREPLGNTAFARPVVATDAPFRLRNGAVPVGELQRTLDRWASAQADVASVAVGLVVDGKTWSGDSVGPAEGNRIKTSERFGTMSLTKVFTAALALREAENGRLQLDSPVPRLAGVRRPPADAAHITPRQLLTHRSGLVDYPGATGYDPDVAISAQRAVTLSLATPLVAPPGTTIHYANTNYLYLGVLLEHVTGRPYADLVAELAAQHRLVATGVEAGSLGWVGHASGGVHSTVGDLGRWGDLLFTPNNVLSAQTVREMKTLGPENIGLGTWPMCPCGTDPAGRHTAAGYGHHVGFGGLYHYPSQMTLVIRIEPPHPDASTIYESLAEEFRGVIRAAIR